MAESVENESDGRSQNAERDPSPGRSPPRLRKILSRTIDIALWAAALFALYSLFGPQKTGPKIDAAAPTLELSYLGAQGTRTFPGELKRPLLIKAFASWCGACRRSVWIEGLGDLTRQDQIDYVAVSVDQDKDDAEHARQTWPIEGEVLFDHSGQFSRDYQVKMLPTYILIGTDGRVKHVTSGFPGPRDYRALAKALK